MDLLLQILEPTEVSVAFLQGMVDRMAVSFHKYGPIKDAYPHTIDALQCAQDRLRRYQETGNTEWLIDAANFLMIEAMSPGHSQAHFRATEAEESPGRISRMVGRTHKDNQKVR